MSLKTYNGQITRGFDVRQHNSLQFICHGFNDRRGNPFVQQGIGQPK